MRELEHTHRRPPDVVSENCSKVKWRTRALVSNGGDLSRTKNAISARVSTRLKTKMSG